ncbi:apolipoprotein M isoform X2 [Engystomops pustulosus]|uniref:apolipoprotein M isoform X2 n=1 Tax=Engystomops pustulosus TaxID=76066 RepID=UPI003AFA3E69
MTHFRFRHYFGFSRQNFSARITRPVIRHVIVCSTFPLQYLGGWYFLAAAAEPGTRALDIFKVMDNGHFTVQESAEMEKLEFRASIRVKDGSCVPRKWIYLLTEERTELRTEGHPDLVTELFSCDCPGCVVLKETDNTSSRLLLYTRSQELDTDCMSDFMQKSTCEGYKEVLHLPRTQEICPPHE